MTLLKGECMKKRLCRTVFIGFLLASVSASAATITLDSSITYQTMNGWIAASFGMGECGPVSQRHEAGDLYQRRTTGLNPSG